MRIALGQFNPVVGDLKNNAQKILRIRENASKAGAELLILPELALCGFPPEDLLLKEHFIKDTRITLEKLAAECPDLTVIIGYPEKSDSYLYNSAAVLQNGSVLGTYRKILINHQTGLNETAYFQPGKNPFILERKGIRAAVTISRDINNPHLLQGLFDNKSYPNLIINLSASPFFMGVDRQREESIAGCAKEFNCPIAFCNLVGGQDELVFDGRSCIFDSKGNRLATAKAFEQDLLLADVKPAKKGVLEITPISPSAPQPVNVIEEVCQALVLGTRDYTVKNGFEKVLLGLSGGIDSSVCAAIAARALGPENVIGVSMPSRFNSRETKEAVKKIAGNLGIKLWNVPIDRILDNFDTSLLEFRGWDNKSVAYENLQARIRGTILMSLSNRFGMLVLTSGNKSESAVGYATLYGDTAGGFAVLKDVMKTLVYQLAEHINKISAQPVIPEDVINRPPSAELRKNQKDTDTLPDYGLLDKILTGYIEFNKSPELMIKEGLPEDIVRKTVRMVDRNEYKRRQSPPGLKITKRAFGRDSKLPITNVYSCEAQKP